MVSSDENDRGGDDDGDGDDGDVYDGKGGLNRNFELEMNSWFLLRTK